MIEKKLNDKIEDTVAGAITQEALFAEPEPSEVDQPEILAADPVTDNPIMEPEQSPAALKPEDVQVAGLGTKIIQGLAKRTKEAEKRVVAPIADEAVQEIGGQLVIREDQANIDAINRGLGGNYVKGLNLPNIQNMNLESPDVGAYLQNLKNLNANLFEQARRGTLNIEAITELAESKDLGRVVYDWAQRKPGEASNSEDLLAGIIALDQIMRDTGRAWDTAAGLSGSQRDMASTRAMQLMNLEAQVAANISGATSEAGRVLYTARTLQQAGLPNASERVSQLYGLESAQDVEHMGRLYMALPNPSQKAEFAKKGLVAKGVDAMIEIWINSILTSPVTHMVNIAGNTSFMMLRNLETFGAAGVGRVRSAITGNAERIRMREGLAQLEGIRQGMFDAFLVAGKTAFTEETSDFVSKIDVRNRRAIGTTGDPRVIADEIKNGNYVAAAINTFGAIQRLGGRALLAEDELFKGIGYRMHLHQMAEAESGRLYDDMIAAGKTQAEAMAASVERKVEMLMNPSAGLVSDARDAARQMTFQGDMDGFLGNLQSAMSHPLIKLFVPFFKTPSNVMREAFLRNPITAPLMPTFRNAIKAGGREADLAVSRVATGSAIMGVMGYMAMGLYGEDNEVIVLGSGPTDTRARQAMQRQGFQPYSINIRQEDGTYRSITYSRFDPVSGVLAMAADFGYYAQYEEDADMLDAVGTALVLSMQEYALQMPFLQGVQELGAALTNPDPAVKAEMIQKLMAEKVAGAALSAIPTVSSFTAGVARLEDPVARATGLPEGQVPFTDMDITDAPTWMQGFYSALQKAKARNPFFNQDLPPRLNEWGEVMTVGTGAGYEFWSPIRIQDTKYSEIDDEMVRLGGGISRTPKKISGVTLNANQYNRWIELTNSLDANGRLPGQSDYDDTSTLKPALSDMIFMPEYLNLPDNDERLKAIVNRVGAARSKAKIYLYQEYPELKDKVDAAK